MEKEMTTPDLYPLSMNALKNACNQKSNRDPVVHYDENTIEDAVYTLRDKQLVCRITASGSRVAKYKHTVSRCYSFSDAECAIICLLFLRGPQTLGELRGRSGRMFEFKSIEDVSEVVENLIRRPGGALIVKLPRETGRKEPRYAHLLSGPVEIDASSTPESDADHALPVDELKDLKEQITTLRVTVETLQSEFAEFKKQFE